MLSQDPQNVDAFFNLGALAEGRGDLIVALGHYRAAHALNPKDKQITEAVSSMEKALKQGGNGSDTRITRSCFSLTPAFALPHPLPVGGTIASPVDFTNTGFGGSLSAFPQRPQGQNLLTPSGYSASAAAPVLLPSADPAPVSQDGQLFQLTGTQNAAMPPVVPVQQNNQSPPSLTVGNSQSGVAQQVRRVVAWLPVRQPIWLYPSVPATPCAVLVCTVQFVALCVYAFEILSLALKFALCCPDCRQWQLC
ncbi:MAG: tetratricopeptide repeat protein [Candidatus Obscuribacter sp.]|nr:tetratricopeptide repeat protein [Candidatus Obscuribacter sp.]